MSINTDSLGFFQRWLKRRIPPNKTQVLHHKNIFILPSVTGVCFLLLVFLLWLLGTNYQNNLAIILAFLLLSLMHTCMFYTYASLSGLSFEVVSVSPCFLGESAQVQCRVHSRSGRIHNNIQVSGENVLLREFTQHKQKPQLITLLISPYHRGNYRAKRIRVASHYPLGLLTAWSQLDMDISVLTYPKPIATSLPENTQRLADIQQKNKKLLHHTVNTQTVNDEISHLRAYQKGDSLRQIAWKSYAKGQGLSSKEYGEQQKSDRELWLSWDDFASLPAETRLSKLCDCVLQAEALSVRYGLELPQQIIGLDRGKQHQQHVLSALALFDNHVSYSHAHSTEPRERKGHL